MEINEEEKRYFDLVERAEEFVHNDLGVLEKNVFESKCTYVNDSYFQYMVDLKLEGIDKEPTSQEMWETMKRHINYLSGNLAQATEKYRKQENSLRGLKQDYDSLIREIKK